MAHHRNMIVAVVPGTLYYTVPDHQKKMAAVSNGMVKVEDNEVLVLVDSAEQPEDIDAIRAKREADEAKEEILQKRGMQEYHLAQARLARAINRLKGNDTTVILWRKGCKKVCRHGTGTYLGNIAEIPGYMEIPGHICVDM